MLYLYQGQFDRKIHEEDGNGLTNAMCSTKHEQTYQLPNRILYTILPYQVHMNLLYSLKRNMTQ